MLELALFIGAQVAPLPVLTLDLQPAAQTAALDPVPTRTARFIRDGGLGDEIWVDLPLDAPLSEPAPTPSIRVSVRAGDRSVEIEARRGGQALEAISVGFARSALGELAQYDGVLTVVGYAQEPDGAWVTTRPGAVRSLPILLKNATVAERMASLKSGTSRAQVRALLGTPGKVDGRVDWYSTDMLVFDADDRFERWQPMGC